MPGLRPPAVIDADVLLRHVDYSLTKGYGSALLDVSGPRDLFIALETMHEVRRHLPDIAPRRGCSIAEVEEAWNRWAADRVSVVALQPSDIDDVRVDGVDAKDFPSARLACLLAPCVLLTDNRRDYPTLVPARPRTDVIARDLHAIGRLEAGTQASLVVPRAATAAVSHASRRFAGRFGPEATTIAAIALGLAALAALNHPRGRRAIQRVGAVAERPELTLWVASVTESRERVARFTVPAAGRPTWCSVAARTIAGSGRSVSGTQLQRCVSASKLLDGPHDVESLMSAHAAFRETSLGHWWLGERPPTSLTFPPADTSTGR